MRGSPPDDGHRRARGARRTAALPHSGRRATRSGGVGGVIDERSPGQKLTYLLNFCGEDHLLNRSNGGRSGLPGRRSRSRPRPTGGNPPARRSRPLGGMPTLSACTARACTPPTGSMWICGARRARCVSGRASELRPKKAPPAARRPLLPAAPPPCPGPVDAATQTDATRPEPPPAVICHRRRERSAGARLLPAADRTGRNRRSPLRGPATPPPSARAATRTVTTPHEVLIHVNAE
jgi:hypothetical protein